MIAVPAFEERRAQSLFVAGLVGLLVLLSVQYTLKVSKHRADGQTRSAILRWTPQLNALHDGENINERFNYPNPPIMALILSPLTLLPLTASALTWFYLKVGMVLASLWMAFRLVEVPERPFPAWAKALTVLLSLRPIMSDLSHGNVNILILFLCVLSVYAFARGRDFAAGVVMALAIACKLTPAVFVAYFVWKRAWRALAGTLVGLGLFFVLVPGVALGFDRNAELLASWFEGMVKPFVMGGVVTTDHPNQSLPGLLYRLLTVSPSFSDYVRDVYTPTEYHNVAALAPETVRLILKGLMGLFALGVVLTCHSRSRGGWAQSAEVGLMFCGMLLFSERTWKHHCVTLVVPFAVVCYALAAVPMGTWLRRGLWASLGVAVAAMATTSSGLLGGRAAEVAQVYGGFTAALVAVAGGLFALLAARRTEGARLS